MNDLVTAARATLLGGALGDALGEPVEFLSRAAMPADLRPGPHISDDTQMTLFTAEGLIRARLGGLPRTGELFAAYRRWLLTQDREFFDAADGWLLGQRDLWAQRAPGLTCLSALRRAEPGTVEEPRNNSKGCGGVMRAAPAGFLADPETAYQVGCDSAALTHGHPSGWVAAGALAMAVHLTAVAGLSLGAALPLVTERVAATPGGEEVLAALLSAIRAAEDTPADFRVLAGLGEGWVAEETLAIAVYSALSHPADARAALLLAVAHDGDSDSTGAVAGNLLGASGAALPADWLAGLELADVIGRVAEDLVAALHGSPQGLIVRYPSYPQAG
ncbi:putative ADP-ribosylglycohydrolase [Longispora fulva]|uniref:ADP-ribosylglycohydrolase n=1 Tax=Longispora fulva TaxID=619741 RepID=A0A8J7GH90_9ACTN|nr:ADP-ribosylglycohydrolase family protein [Longispora fulva]MBG6140658.1 ADP-ribosylglycohydrolase [Longispora fulva]GIG63679.1 putative ADP-ribosylglycohydrolase [Longispora fulva]